MSGRKKRFWSDDEKREICGQATTPGISVAQVARRYAVNANLIHKWLKDPRFAPSAAAVEDDFDIAAFLPVEVNVSAPSDLLVTEAASATPTSALSANRVDITQKDKNRRKCAKLRSYPTSVGFLAGQVAIHAGRHKQESWLGW